MKDHDGMKKRSARKGTGGKRTAFWDRNDLENFTKAPPKEGGRWG